MEMTSESEEDTSEKDTGGEGAAMLGESAKLKYFALNLMIEGASRKANTRGNSIEIICRPRVSRTRDNIGLVRYVG